MNTTPTPEQSQALSLFTLLFSAPPGAWKDALFQVRGEAGSLSALADLLVGTPQFQARFAGKATPTQILDTFLSFIGLVPGTPAHAAAGAAVLAQLQAGASVGTVTAQVLQFLQTTAEPLFQPARQYLSNMVEVATYHTVTLGLSGTSVDGLRTLLAKVTADPASVAQAKQALDQLAAPPDPGPPAPPPPPPALTSADTVGDIHTKMGAYAGTAATANATGMTALQLEALGGHTAKIQANGITGLALDLGAAQMTDAISAALLGKATGASVVATNATSTEVDSLVTLVAHIADNSITGTLPVTPSQLADVRGALAPKLAAGLTLAVAGTALADTIDLTALANAATAAGGADNDTYVVDSATHTVTEAAGGGTDTVQSAISYTLPGEVEVLSLTGSSDIDGTGLAGNDTLIGNTGNNLLSGAAGNDVLTGGAGNDTLDGGTGIDTLTGGTGNDLYYIDELTEIADEANNEGTDTVVSSVNYTLGTYVEVLSLTGSAISGTTGAFGGTIYGNAQDNQLQGTSGGNDALYGGDGNDTLNGINGLDSLYGGNGNDRANLQGHNMVYFDGGDGDDTAAITLVSTLAQSLTLIGGATAGQDSITVSGTSTHFNFSSSTITNFDVFTFSTMWAAQTLTLGSNVTNDQGYVTVRALSPSTSAFTINANALNAATGVRIEGAVNFQGNDSLTGGAGNDTIEAGSGNDTLLGGQGNDYLVGGAGQDVLNGGAGNDTFAYTATAEAGDTVVGFTGGGDRLEFNQAGFGFTDLGTLSADRFINLSGDAVTSALYSNPASFWVTAALSGVTGNGAVAFVLSDNKLYIDPDGAGAAAGYVVAEFASGAGTITHADLFIV